MATSHIQIIVPCPKNSDHLSSSMVTSAADNNWVNFDDNDENVYLYKKANIEKAVKYEEKRFLQMKEERNNKIAAGVVVERSVSISGK